MGFAIIHTFPNGQRIETGHLRAGYTQQIARYSSADEVGEAIERMTETNPGHTFEAVPFPAEVEHLKRTQREAQTARRALLNRGISCSLIAFDPSRDRYVFGEFTR